MSISTEPTIIEKYFPLSDKTKLGSIRDQMSNPNKGGRLVGGAPPRYTQELAIWIKSQLGLATYNRALLISPGLEQREGGNSVTALGGICAFRTRDLQAIHSGEISDPQRFNSPPLKFTSVEELAAWIKAAIGIDQIVGAIGECQSGVVISEAKLWTERVNGVLSQRSPSMGKAERQQIEDAVEEAEKLRFQAVQRYLTYLGNQGIPGNGISRGPNLSRVVDRDIMPELIEIRDDTLDLARTSVNDLARRTSTAPDYIDRYSIVWGMYTGYYLEMLKAKGYVSTKYGMLVEPWMHATSEVKAKQIVNENIFRNPGNQYLRDVVGNPNRNLGFLAYADVADPRGNRVWSSKQISEVPTPGNYMQFITSLRADPRSGSVTLQENPVLLWGVGLMPVGKCEAACREMLEIQSDYKARRSTLKKEASSSEKLRGDGQKTRELKQAYEPKIAREGEIVISELEKLLTFVFSQDNL